MRISSTSRTKIISGMRHFLQAPPCSSRQLLATGHPVSGIQTLKCKDFKIYRTSSGNSEMCEKKRKMIWLVTHIPPKHPRPGMPPNKKWNPFLSCIQGSLILAHFVPVGAGPMKFTKASSNQPLVLVVAKKWCYLQMNVVISNMYTYRYL